MALSRGRLTNGVVNVSAGTTVGIVTVASNKKVYIKSIIAHNGISTTSINAHVYYVPNGGSVSANTYSNFDNNNSRSDTNFFKKNTYVSCGSSSYYLYNNYTYQDLGYNFRCKNPWQNQKNYRYYDTKDKKWINTYVKK